MTVPDLKPCPFCGGEARKWQDPSHSAAWFIGCDDGYSDCFGSIHWAETEAEAIAAWNRRAALPARWVGVKPLVWEPSVIGKPWHSAKAPWGWYYAQWDDETQAWFASLEMGEVEAPILSALEPDHARETRDAQMRAEGRVAGLREAAQLATSFLVGDPFNDIQLRNPMAHEISDYIRALADKIEKGEGDE